MQLHRNFSLFFFVSILFCFPPSLPSGKAAQELLKIGEISPQSCLQDFFDQPRVFPKSGQWNLIFFWSLFCQTCIEEMPFLCDELTNHFYQRCEGFFVCLDTAKMKNGVANFIKKRHLSCQVVFEEVASSSFKTADSWGVKLTPSTFLVDPEGKIVFSKEGPFELEELFGLLRKIPASFSNPLPQIPKSKDDLNNPTNK
ncbi:TlpA family protein disulfide reductase [bacterium]|nr:TlpA family protein disulfide reductase [bacterium]